MYSSKSSVDKLKEIKKRVLRVVCNEFVSSYYDI